MKLYLVSNVLHPVKYYDKKTGALIPKVPGELAIYTTLIPAKEPFCLFPTLSDAEKQAEECVRINRGKKKWPNGTESMEKALAVAAVEVDPANLIKREDGNYDAKKDDIIFVWSASIRDEFQKHTYNFSPKLEGYLSIFRQAAGDCPSALTKVFAQYKNGCVGIKYFRNYISESTKMQETISNVADGKIEQTYTDVIRGELNKYKTDKHKLPEAYRQCLAAAWLGAVGNITREDKSSDIELMENPDQKQKKAAGM